ncbi:MAG: hypothetical protein MJ094_04360 [Saccharofermentans sp.]|nr:hypothetical protein [Saccharofermentans sp.]
MGIFISILAWRMDMNGCPDEPMRYALSKWIMENGKLPIGFEEEIVSPIWGFSYAFTPYWPSMIAALFMRACAIFTTGEQALLFSSRLVSIFAGLGSVFVAFRIGDKVFKSTATVYFMALIIACWPQLLFISSYHNYDSVSLLSSFMILDSVLDGTKSNWRVKDMIYLALGVSICALTYYFGYAWILFAIIGYFYTSAKAGIGKTEIFKKAGYISLLVLLLAGWYFIRNAIIYDGDFLGFKQSEICAAMYSENHEIGLVQNPGRNTMDLMDMMMGKGEWIKITVRSFIGLFGGLVIELRSKMYLFYYMFIFLLVGMFLVSFAMKKSYTKVVLFFGFIFVVIFPVLFSLYSSYTRDFSPQGRYIITIIPALVFMMAEGYDFLLSLINSKSYQLANCFKSLAIGSWILMFLIIITFVLLPLMADISVINLPIEFFRIR